MGDLQCSASSCSAFNPQTNVRYQILVSTRKDATIAGNIQASDPLQWLRDQDTSQFEAAFNARLQGKPLPETLQVPALPEKITPKLPASKPLNLDLIDPTADCDITGISISSESPSVRTVITITRGDDQKNAYRKDPESGEWVQVSTETNFEGPSSNTAQTNKIEREALSLALTLQNYSGVSRDRAVATAHRRQLRALVEDKSWEPTCAPRGIWAEGSSASLVADLGGRTPLDRTRVDIETPQLRTEYSFFPGTRGDHPTHSTERITYRVNSMQPPVALSPEAGSEGIPADNGQPDRLTKLNERKIDNTIGKTYNQFDSEALGTLTSLCPTFPSPMEVTGCYQVIDEIKALINGTGTPVEQGTDLYQLRGPIFH